ncbi:hypothetical protein SBA3_2920014 [Candidatus Sulfopaludibacter sp. SbA3]|nr:hypothetical protein SBA3_2920014 [Candidatus Sulfopaludibacter sp. SbA3]
MNARKETWRAKPCPFVGQRNRDTGRSRRCTHLFLSSLEMA